jgi:hypothetical protein
LLGSLPRPFGPALHAQASKFGACETVELLSLARIALGGHDVAKSAQAVALLGAKIQLLRKLIAFVRCGLGRVGVEAEQRGCFVSKQLCFDRAMPARPRSA